MKKDNKRYGNAWFIVPILWNQGKPKYLTKCLLWWAGCYLANRLVKDGPLKSTCVNSVPWNAVLVYSERSGLGWTTAKNVLLLVHHMVLHRCWSFRLNSNARLTAECFYLSSAYCEAFTFLSSAGRSPPGKAQRAFRYVGNSSHNNVSPYGQGRIPGTSLGGMKLQGKIRRISTESAFRWGSRFNVLCRLLTINWITNNWS